jgi:hypothetical protein
MHTRTGSICVCSLQIDLMREVIDQTFWLISYFYTCIMSYPSYPPRFDHSHNIYSEAQYVISSKFPLKATLKCPYIPPSTSLFSHILDLPSWLETKYRRSAVMVRRQVPYTYKITDKFTVFLFQYLYWKRETWTPSDTTSGRLRVFHFSVAFQHGRGPNQPLIHCVTETLPLLVRAGAYGQTRLHLEPKLRMRRVISPHPQTSS